MPAVAAMNLEQRDEAVKTTRADRPRHWIQRVPLHVIFRMAAVVGHDPLILLDGAVDVDRDQRSQTLSGTLIGFTDSVGSRVILAG
jgi:hypothetical protein